MLSIIIPAYNEEKYLPSLLKSIKSQSFRDYEIIISDNNSRDKTREIAKSFSCRIAEGGMPSKARRSGAKIARGNLFLFLDADCILENDFLESSIKEIERRNLGIAGANVWPISRNIFDWLYFGFFNMFARLMQHIYPHVAGCALFCKKEIYNSSGGFNPKILLFEEHDFTNRARKFGKFRLLNSSSVKTSVRRFKSKGRLKTGLQLVASAVYRMLFGEIKKDVFHYGFEYRK